MIEQLIYVVLPTDHQHQHSVQLQDTGVFGVIDVSFDCTYFDVSVGTQVAHYFRANFTHNNDRYIFLLA